jgi:hypothetical protein
MEFQKGVFYTRQQIRDMVGGGSVHDFLPHEGGRVLCACLSREHVVEELMVILVGAGPGVQAQAEMFRAQKTAVPVFLKKSGHVWEYAGLYRLERFSDDPDEIEKFEESSGRMNLTGLIFLREEK